MAAELSFRHRKEPRINFVHTAVPIAMGLLSLLTGSARMPIRHDVINGKSCEIDMASSSIYLGALQYHTDNPRSVEELFLKGNDLKMRVKMNDLLHIIIARYGATTESMQKDLEELYPNCHVIAVKAMNTGNYVNIPNANVQHAADVLQRFAYTALEEFPDAQFVYIPNFEIFLESKKEDEVVEKQRRDLVTEVKRRFDGNTRILVSRDISPEVVYNMQGEFDPSYLIIKDGKGVHLQPIGQGKLFLIVTNHDLNSFK